MRRIGGIPTFHWYHLAMTLALHIEDHATFPAILIKSFELLASFLDLHQISEIANYDHPETKLWSKLPPPCNLSPGIPCFRSDSIVEEDICSSSRYSSYGENLDVSISIEFMLAFAGSSDHLILVLDTFMLDLTTDPSNC